MSGPEDVFVFDIPYVFFFSPLIVKDQFDFCKLFTTETSCGTSLASQRVVRRSTFLPDVTWLDIPWFSC